MGLVFPIRVHNPVSAKVRTVGGGRWSVLHGARRLGWSLGRSIYSLRWSSKLALSVENGRR